MILSIYGELGRVSYYTRRLFSIIKYWFKIINADNRRYINSSRALFYREIASFDFKDYLDIVNVRKFRKL